MFLEELAGLKNRYMGRLELYHFLEYESEEIELFNGRLDAAKCEEVFASLVDIASADAVFICGPRPDDGCGGTGAGRARCPQGKSVRRALHHRHRLRRATGARRSAAEESAGLEITVTLDGRRARVPFDAAKGEHPRKRPGRRGCPRLMPARGGVCSTCRAKLISGQVTMKKNYGLTEDEIAQGYVLTCQAVPTTDDVVADLR